jgi:hypothetical protein
MRTSVFYPVFLFLILAILTGLGYGIHYLHVDYHENKDVISHQFYSGRVHLSSSEYEEFKSFLADHPDIYISNLEVYSSEDPLVKFAVTTYGGLEFPWGEPGEISYRASRFGQIGLSVMMCLGAVLAILLARLLAHIVDAVAGLIPGRGNDES